MRDPSDRWGAAYGALLDAVRGVRWAARRPVAGSLPGAHHSRLRGAAPELSEYRPYRQGDEAKRIDWRLLARSDRAYIRLADDRSVLPTMLVVDASASMAFPARSLDKWRLACLVTVGLAAVAHASRDPVGLVVVSGDGVRRLAPRTRRGVVGEIARTLEAVAPRGSASLAPAVAGAERGARGRVVVVSDFLGDADDARRAAGERAAAGGEVHAVHVVASEELDPPARPMLAVDPEDPAIVRPLVADARVEYLERFAAWREQLAASWRGEGLGYTLAVTSEPPARAVRQVAGVPRGANRLSGER